MSEAYILTYIIIAAIVAVVVVIILAREGADDLEAGFFSLMLGALWPGLVAVALIVAFGRFGRLLGDILEGMGRTR